MAHELFQNRMAYVGEVPWHGLGIEVPPSVSAPEMIRAANLDWKVHKQPAPGARALAGDPSEYEKYAIMRDPVGDEIEEAQLALVGRDYQPLQNEDAFRFFEPFIENGWAEFHTAGALYNGERVWVMVRLVDDIVIGGNEVVQKYVLLSNSHDGRAAIKIRFTPVRVVCQNTLSYAEKGGSGIRSVSHSKYVQERLEEVQTEKLKQIVDKVFADATAVFQRMARLKIGEVETSRYLTSLFPPSERQRDNGKVPERWVRVRQILEDARVTPPDTRDTLWGLYNAVVRDEDYRVDEGKMTAESRLNRVWFGTGADLKIRALEEARRQLETA